MGNDENLQSVHERTGVLADSALRDDGQGLDNERMQIGKVIRTLRQEQGLTLEELALRVGSDAGNLSRVERGKQRYTPELLQAIADALRIPVSHLFLHAEQKRAEQKLPGYEISGRKPEAERLNPESEYFPSLRRAVVGLDPENQKLVLEFARLLARQSRIHKTGGSQNS